MDGLKPRSREEIIAHIAANGRMECAALLGSRAKGTLTASSGVDLALFGSQLTLNDQTRIAAAIDKFLWRSPSIFCYTTLCTIKF